MNTLLDNKDLIFEIKRKVEQNDDLLYFHVVIPNIQITDETITIVMTASNRSNQTYFTLQTIQNSSNKAVQVILVDDSDEDPITKEALEKYPFYIDFICIRRENKNWVNPVVNYNIGFQYIKGSKVVIQNAEVCHIGDVLSYMRSQITSNNYYVCDVKSSNSLDENNVIYEDNTNSIDIYNHISGILYQGKERIVNYHFLSGMTLETFNKIKTFSYDYSLGIAYDDNDFLLKIISNNINVINLFHDEYNFGGIHLWHKTTFIRKGIESNENIFYKKKDYYLKTGKYIDIIEEKTHKNIDIIEEKIEIIKINIKSNTNLLELQNLFMKFTNNKILYFYINKKQITPSINTFRKCILKGYHYKNSRIKIPKNFKIKFYFI